LIVLVCCMCSGDSGMWTGPLITPDPHFSAPCTRSPSPSRADPAQGSTAPSCPLSTR
jgi:hypothetical protein